MISFNKKDSMKIESLIIVATSLLSLVSCEEEPQEIQGCTNSAAINYNSEATIDNGSCTFPAPLPVDTVYKFVLIEYPTANNYEAMTDLKIGINTSGYSSAIAPEVTELQIGDGSGDLISDCENALIYPPNQDTYHIFYSQTNIASTLSIEIYRISDHQLIYSYVFNSNGTATTSSVYATDYYRANRGTGAAPVVMWYIKI